jgi:hypothetical protein
MDGQITVRTVQTVQMVQMVLQMSGRQQSIHSESFPSRSRFVRILHVKFCQNFRCVQVESCNPLVLISSGGPSKLFGIIPKWAATITSVNFGVKNSCKFEMFISVDDLNRTWQNLFTAREWIRKMWFYSGYVENRVNA